MNLEQWGAFAFGAVLGWLTYFTNRYRKGDVQFADLATLLGIIGGGGITALFGNGRAALFGAYGLGLAAGFFAYFLVLLLLVASSGGQFTLAWFLDGRRKTLPAGFEPGPDARSTTAPMSMRMLERVSASIAATGAGGDTPLAAASAERDRAIQAMTQTIRQVMQRQLDTGDDTERQSLRDVQLSLTHAMQELIAVRLHDIIADPRVGAALNELKQITKAMEKDAAEIKAATETLTKATQILQKAGKVIGLVTGIFG